MREELRQSRKLLLTLEFYASELRDSHEDWKDRLQQAKPESDLSQIASEAMELALKELEVRLPSESNQGESEALPSTRQWRISAVIRCAAKGIATATLAF